MSEVTAEVTGVPSGLVPRSGHGRELLEPILIAPAERECICGRVTTSVVCDADV